MLAPKLEAPEPNDEPLGYEMNDGGGPRRFYAPATLAQLQQLFAKHPEATILAGATRLK